MQDRLSHDDEGILRIAKAFASRIRVSATGERSLDESIAHPR
jgi:hypothetical protein